MTAVTRTRDEYHWLAPLLAELAALPPDDPARDRLQEQVIRGYLPVARHIARRFSRRGEPLADLEQVAALGLVQAVRRFQPDRGSDFLSFAVPTIVGEVRRYFRDHAWAMRVPRRLKELHLNLAVAITDLTQDLGRAPSPRELANHLDLPLENIIDGLGAADAYNTRSLDALLDADGTRQLTANEIGHTDPEFRLLEYRDALVPLLAALTERERTILSLRFFGNQTQTQIAKQLGISQMHVSRLLARTLHQLRDQLAE